MPFRRHQMLPALFALSLCAALATHAQQKQPTEAQCRQMTGHMLGVMKSTSIQPEKEKERKEAKALLERAEKTIKDGRGRKEGECVIWSAVNRLIVHQ